MNFESETRRAFEPARQSQPKPDAINYVMEEFDRLAIKKGRHRRHLGVAASSLACGLALMLGIPQSRAAVLDRIGSFLEGGAAPGEQLNATALPGYTDLTNAFKGAGPSAAAIIARHGKARLFAWRESADMRPCFSLDRAESMCFDADALQTQLKDDHFVVLATTDAIDGKGGLIWGVVEDGAQRVDFQYLWGDVTSAPSPSNGFILPIDVDRPPTALKAIGAAGKPLFSVPTSKLRPLGIASISVGPGSPWSPLQR